MEKLITERFHQGIVDEACRRYAIAKEDIQQLESAESYIFEFQKDGASYILRLSHSHRRTIPHILGEVDWINYLSDHNVPAARAILSENGALVELIPDGHGLYFMATAFVKARGKSPWDGLWTPTVFEAYGRAMGRMHAVTKDYEPTNSAWQRPEWDDPMNMFAEKWLSPKDAAITDKFLGLVKTLQTLPKDRDSYGLIHQDAHGGNFFVDEHYNLTFFDFDDCVYSWFIYDIAMVVFYYIANGDDMVALTHELMEPFLRGYHSENALNPMWLQHLPTFLKLREIDLYAIIHRSFDVDNIEDEWISAFMRGRRELLNADIPYVDVDFTQWATILSE